jgi:hypothetical protein
MEWNAWNGMRGMECMVNGQVHGLTALGSPGLVLAMFKSGEKHLQETLHPLEEMGLGIEFGRVDIFTLTSTKPTIERCVRWAKLACAFDLLIET